MFYYFLLLFAYTLIEVEIFESYLGLSLAEKEEEVSFLES
jgi:hypothetical protein